MSATGRDLRETLNGTQSSGSGNNAIFYGVLVGIAMLAIIAVLAMTMLKPSSPMDFVDAEGSAQTFAGKPAPIDQNGNYDSTIATVNAFSKDDLMGMRVQQIKLFNSTTSELQTCGRSLGEETKFKMIRKSYEKRNADKVDHWRNGFTESGMLRRAASGEASDIEIGLYAMSGGMQQDALNRMAMFEAEIGGMSGGFGGIEDVDRNECRKLAVDVQTKKLEVKPVPR